MLVDERHPTLTTNMHACRGEPNQILVSVSLPTSFGMAAESLDPAPPMVSRALHFDSGRTKKDAELFDLALSKRDGTLWCDSGRQKGCQIPQRVCPQNSGAAFSGSQAFDRRTFCMMRTSRSIWDFWAGPKSCLEVCAVIPDGIAALKGTQPSDLITSVNDKVGAYV